MTYSLLIYPKSLITPLVQSPAFQILFIYEQYRKKRTNFDGIFWKSEQLSQTTSHNRYFLSHYDDHITLSILCVFVEQYKIICVIKLNLVSSFPSGHGHFTHFMVCNILILCVCYEYVLTVHHRVQSSIFCAKFHCIHSGTFQSIVSTPFHERYT